MMFNNGLPDLSLFCCISLLCLPHCLSAHITCAVCSSAFYALCAMSILCTVPLLFNSAAALSSFFTHESPSTNNQKQPQIPTATTTPLLFSVPCIYSFCAPCACNVLHSSACSNHANLLHLSSALLIIIVTLQLLWRCQVTLSFQSPDPRCLC
jgi:hypothetical protein